MAYNVDKEFNLLKEMPNLEKAVFDQGKCNCCWAISVATAIGYLYCKDSGEEEFQLSPQDIVDHVWHYYPHVHGKERDSAGCYKGSPSLGYSYVKHFGVGFLAKYEFRARLDEGRGPIDNISEFPRIFTGEPRDLYTVQDVIKTLKEEKQAVVATIIVSPSFVSYTKEMGVYKTPPGIGDGVGKHNLVIVGVNEEENYFIVRNSWGPDWGDHGYARVDFGSLYGFSTPSSAYPLDSQLMHVVQNSTYGKGAANLQPCWVLRLESGGGLAEYAMVKEDLEEMIVIKPCEVSAIECAAGLGTPALTAYQCLITAGVKVDKTGPPMNVLVTAASGGVGDYAVQLGNIHVTASCGARNAAFVRSLEADEILDYVQNSRRASFD
ncbi:hypothetical protein ACET3Z_008962 [Daucus carota]